MSPPHPTSCSPPAPIDRLDAGLAAGVFFVALLTRLRFLLLSPDRAWPHSALFEGDAPLWARWAGDLAAGREFERGLAIHSPAVAYVLRWLGCSDATADFTAPKAVWCVVSAVGVAFAYLAFRLELSRRASFIGAGLLAFAFSSYVTATSLNGEAIYAAILPLIVIGTLGMARRPSWFTAASLGLCHGVATLIRPEHTLLLAMFLAWALWARRGDLRAIRPAIRMFSAAAVTALVSVAVCLPWSFSTARATERFNTIPAPPPDYAHAVPPWTADGRAYLDSLPAFARADNFAYLSALARQKGLAEVNQPTIQAYFTGVFGSVPDALATWHLVSGQGPLCFALANHPQATGGFSKAALATPFSADPELKFSLPTHVYLYNHGYRAGWDWIRGDPKRWGSLVLRKLAIFGEGAAQGLTARNWPLGLDGERRAVDQFTAESWAAPWWRALVGALLALGLVAAVRRRAAALWLLVLLSKVIVTAAFYGYARQAASILPALAVFAALGLDALLVFVGRVLPRVRERITPRGAIALGAAAVAALLVADLTAPLPAESPAPQSTIHPAPRWGPGAWESSEDVLVTPLPGR